MVKKDPINCPICVAECGYPSNWGFSPEGWDEVEKRHLEEHCKKCPTCGQPIYIEDTTPSETYTYNSC